MNYEYDKQDGLDAAQRSYLPAQGGAFSLVAESHRNSVFLTGHQDLWPGGTLYLDGIYSDRTYETNYTEYSSTINYRITAPNMGTASQSGIGTKLESALFSDWIGDLTANYSRVGQSSFDNVSYVSSGTLLETSDSIESTKTNVLELDASASGTLFVLPGGAIKAAVGGSFYIDQFDQTVLSTIATSASSKTTPSSVQAPERHVGSAYGEITIPLIGERNSFEFTKRLEVSVATRYDNYSDFGSSINPKFGLLWEPVSGASVRATYGTSFEAPTLSQLYSEVFSVAENLPDANVPAGRLDGLYLSGGNQSLTSQTARSATLGFDLKPDFFPGFTASVSYFHTNFNQLITTPVGNQTLSLSNPNFAPFVTLNPSLAVVQSYFNSPGFKGDQTKGGPGAVQAILTNQNANLAFEREGGLDFSMQYATSATDWGKFNVLLGGTALFENLYQSTALSVPFSLLSAYAEPAPWKLRGGAGWSQDGFHAQVYLNYTGSYHNSQFTPAQSISSWTTTDLNLGYDTEDAAFAPELAHLSLVLNVQNLFDVKPPYVAANPSNFLPGVAALTFDPTNSSPVGRLISFQLIKRF